MTCPEQMTLLDMWAQQMQARTVDEQNKCLFNLVTKIRAKRSADGEAFLRHDVQVAYAVLPCCGAAMCCLRRAFW